jgi:hypothetical protein
VNTLHKGDDNSNSNNNNNNNNNGRNETTTMTALIKIACIKINENFPWPLHEGIRGMEVYINLFLTLVLC